MLRDRYFCPILPSTNSSIIMKNSIRPNEISAILEKELESFNSPNQLEEVGTVLEISDGVALVYGLHNVQVGEVVLFEQGERGMTLNLEKGHVGVVILNGGQTIQEGHHVRRTKEIVSLHMGTGLLGRVVNTFGEPIDGKGAIEGTLFEMPLERRAPGVIYREPVVEPLQTGVKKIDTMIPIGRGQRELILGDRGTGKTTLAIDTIINQRRNFEEGKPVHCIYVAIGQKASTVAQIVATLKKHGAMEYTIVLLASASEVASLQFLAPFAGMAMGEFFRDMGQDALVVFDDLSKHAVVYRELSLLLKRVPGREAYPGDVFYLHSRLLERAGKINRNDSVASAMNDIPPALKNLVKGGGSLTALPIIETQNSDVSAYIPTNVISITDGQIFLETDLFNSGVRPAINIGISVSRVSGAAQLPAMRKVAGKLKIEQAQFLELESFSKLGAELDSATQRIIDRGRKNRELLKQPPYAPVPVEYQIVMAFASVSGFLDHVPEENLHPFIEAYIKALTVYHADLLKEVSQGILTDEMKKVLRDVATKVVRNYNE